MADQETVPGGEPDVCQARCVNADDVARARAHLLPSDLYAGLAALFDALGDPTRARIVHVLLSQEMCTCDLSAVVGVSESAVSQHLRLLRALRLVRSRRAGKLVYYSLDDGHVSDLVRTGLTHLGHAEEIIPLSPRPAAGGRTA
jgi:ArsR family transcriptional regulator, lead/cadmium/zinc/bismuth-responsive transcriptional repressor